MLNFPAANAKRYVEIGGVPEKRTRVRPAPVARSSSAPLPSASHPSGTSSASDQRAFRSG